MYIYVHTLFYYLNAAPLNFLSNYLQLLRNYPLNMIFIQCGNFMYHTFFYEFIAICFCVGEFCSLLERVLQFFEGRN